MKNKTKIYVLGAISLLAISMIGCNKTNINKENINEVIQCFNDEDVELQEKEFDGFLHNIEITGNPSKTKLLSMLNEHAKTKETDDFGYISFKVNDDLSLLDFGLMFDSNIGKIIYADDYYIDALYEKDYSKKPTNDEFAIYKEFVGYIDTKGYSIDNAIDEISKAKSMDKEKVSNAISKCVDWETSFIATEEYIPSKLLNDTDISFKRVPIVDKDYNDTVLKVSYDVVIHNKKTADELKKYSNELKDYVIKKYGKDVEVEVYFYDEYTVDINNLGNITYKNDNVEDNICPNINWDLKPTKAEYDMYEIFDLYSHILNSSKELSNIEVLNRVSERENIDKTKLKNAYDKVEDWNIIAFK